MVELEHRGQPVRVRQRPYRVTGSGDLDRAGHVEGQILEQVNLVDDRDLASQAVGDEPGVVALGNRALDVDSALRGRVDGGGGFGEVDLAGDDADDPFALAVVGQPLERHGSADPEPYAARGGGVVADHGRLRDHSLRDRLHGQAADDRCRIVEQHERHVLNVALALLQRALDRPHDAPDVVGRALDPACSYQVRAEVRDASGLDVGHAHLGGRVPNVDPNDQRHAAAPSRRRRTRPRRGRTQSVGRIGG